MSSFCSEPPSQLLLRGIHQLNQGKFFEQHETLEKLWLLEKRSGRRLYQGILQIGIAAYQIKRLNHHGAVHMLTRGTGYLRPFAPICESIDVSNLLIQSERILQEVHSLGPEGLAEFNWSLTPTVRFVGLSDSSYPL